MDVRSIEDVEPVVEHNGTVPVWWLVNPREMFDITKGGHLELVSEFEVAGGGLVDPHHHPTHEFYYVTSGRGLMTIEGEEREIAQGDLVHIPPNAVHSLRPVSDNAPIHCFCFAVGVEGAGEINYTVEDSASCVEAVLKSFGDRIQSIDHLDGVTVDLGDGSWFNLRTSNTEPLLRLNVEARTTEDVDAVVGLVSAEIASHTEKST